MLGSLHIFRNYCVYSYWFVLLCFYFDDCPGTVNFILCIPVRHNLLVIQVCSLWFSNTVLSVFGEYSCILILFIMSVHIHNVKDGMTTYINDLQNSEYRGLLGNGHELGVYGRFPGDSASMLQNSPHLLHKSKEPYRPRQLYKVRLITFLFYFKLRR